MSRIPNNESKASWTIKQKTEKPESAVTHAPAVSGYNYEIGRRNVESGYANYCDDAFARMKAHQRETMKGRPAGSRVEWDEKLQMFRIM